MKRFTTMLGVITWLLVSSSNAQQRWERNYGGSADDHGFSVQQTTDGGYIVGGYTSSYGAGYADAYLVKTNASGDTLWTRTYGGAYSDGGRAVQQTSDGGYIVTGLIDGYDVWLVKTNASGDTLWTRRYRSVNNGQGLSVQQTSDGGYIVVGYTAVSISDSQIYLIKTNASGDTLWTRTYGGGGLDYGYSVQQTTDGGYIVGGYSSSYGNARQVLLLKTNASGGALWTKTYGGASTDRGYSVQQTTDGGYIIVGATNSFGAGSFDVYLIKTDASGDTLWTRTYGGTNDEYGYSVRQTADGGYIVSGYTKSFGAGDQDAWLIKTDASGDTLWTRTYGGAGTDDGYSVRQTSDGGYIIAGTTGSFGVGGDVYLIKTDANGNVGVEEGQTGERQVAIGRITAKPNPFVSYATIPAHLGERFKLYDVMGRMVGTYQGDRVGEGLAPGVYFLRSSDSNDKPLRIVKVR